MDTGKPIGEKMDTDNLDLGDGALWVLIAIGAFTIGQAVLGALPL